jgi:hypothetical protein
VLLVALFAVGEGIGGEEGWWGHLIQLAIAAGLVAGAWFVPKVFGPLLVLLGVAPVVAMLATGAAAGVIGSSVLTIWLPMVLAGVFVCLAGYGRQVSAQAPPEDDLSGAARPM